MEPKLNGETGGMLTMSGCVHLKLLLKCSRDIEISIFLRWGEFYGLQQFLSINGIAFDSEMPWPRSRDLSPFKCFLNKFRFIRH